jgi:hypothetical protein
VIVFGTNSKTFVFRREARDGLRLLVRAISVAFRAPSADVFELSDSHALCVDLTDGKRFRLPSLRPFSGPKCHQRPQSMSIIKSK